MAFPNDLYIASAYSGDLYKYVNDELDSSFTVNLGTNANPQGVFVAQDQRTIYTANRENNSISVVHDGIDEGYVTIGSQPFSICEDSYGAIYVTCYADNKVYKIERTVSDTTTITAVIGVDSGPTGICCDSNDTVWVACSNAGTINKIVNNVVTLKIPCADTSVDNAICQPKGICCDRANNIWVANYGSGTVIRITNSHKVQTIDVDDQPFDVITDSNNNLYVCSYAADTVTYYSMSDINNPKKIQLPADSGPTALGINRDNEVYVVGSLSNQIFKIKNFEIVLTKTTQNITPAGFGDPTGCKAYNIFNRGNEGNQTLTPAASAIQLMSNLKLTFKVDSLSETIANSTFTLSSDVISLKGFDHLKLNGVACTVNTRGQAIATLPNVPAFTTLELVGYFDAVETENVSFIPVDYDDIFKIVVGSMENDGSGNFLFTPASDPIRVANINDQINSIVINTVADGNICVLIPSRVASKVEQGIVVNGMQIYEDWAVNPDDQAGVSAALSTGYPNYKAYINPYPAYTGTSVILNRYKL